MFKRTTAINKMLKMNARKRVVQGSTSAGKTHGIVPILIDKATKKKLKITVVAETIPAVREGAVDIFKQVMQDTNRWIEGSWRSNPYEYTFGNGSVMQFRAYDTEGKAKAAGKRDILFMNECNHIKFKIADQLMTRSKEIWMDYNPDTEFWAHTEVIPEKESEFLKITFEDNEAIPPELLQDLMTKKAKAFYNPHLPDDRLFDEGNIKSKYWSNWWRVYGMGETGTLEGVIFQNWEIIEEIPKDAKLLGRGLDFGFTNDPTSLMALYSYNNEYYFDEEIYQRRLTNPSIAKKMQTIGVTKYDTVVADGSEPKSIEEINAYGFTVKGTGKKDILFRVDLLQSIKFYVTARSVNTIKELRNYAWDEDRAGNKLNKPIDDWNHSIDSMGYIAEKTIAKKAKRKPKARAHAVR